jgi:hypothetical protein
LLSTFIARREALQSVAGVGLEIIGPHGSEPTMRLLEFARANRLPYAWQDAAPPDGVEWQQAGVWETLHALLLSELNATGEIEWSRAVADSSHVQAKKGRGNGPEPGRQSKTRLEAPSPRRRERDPARVVGHRRQPQRRNPARPARGAGAYCARQGRPARGADRLASPPTAATTMTSTGASCAGAGSHQRSLAATQPTAPGSAAPAGWSSAPSPGCTT